MVSEPEMLISKFVAFLRAMQGVRAIALVGSRGARDPRLVDPYSDADFLILCDDEIQKDIVQGNWIDEVEKPLLVFPQVMDDEIRILFSNLFACELHILTMTKAKELSGPCRLGSYFKGGLSIRYDPEGLLSELAGRIQPEVPEERNPEITSSVFWYNVAYCANLIARGDLFRASQFSNRYLQLFLLELFYDIEEPGSTKDIQRKIPPDDYQALAASVAPLDRKSMIAGLERCMECYWRFQKKMAPGIEPDLLATYKRIEDNVLRLLKES